MSSCKVDGKVGEPNQLVWLMSVCMVPGTTSIVNKRVLMVTKVLQIIASTWERGMQRHFSCTARNKAFNPSMSANDELISCTLHALVDNIDSVLKFLNAVSTEDVYSEMMNNANAGKALQYIKKSPSAAVDRPLDICDVLIPIDNVETTATVNRMNIARSQGCRASIECV